MSYTGQFLSKICLENDIKAISRYDIREHHIITKVEQEAYNFILDYARKNNGQAPQGETVEAEVDGFTYFKSSEGYDFLAENIKNLAKLNSYKNLLANPELKKIFGTGDGKAFEEFLQQNINETKAKTDNIKKVGVSAKKDIDSYIAELNRRIEGKSFKTWNSGFPGMLEAVGPYIGGNYYAWFGRSGRGKSVLVILDAVIEAALQGATVLLWSLEMPLHEILSRIYTLISAKFGAFTQRIDGIMEKSGFYNNQLRTGKIEPEIKEKLIQFLRELNEKLPGDIIIRSVDDADFHDRSCTALESEIEVLNADVVAIDPIYYMDMERNESKTQGGEIAATSKRLRRIAGSTGVVMHVVTQAQETKEETNKKRERRLMVPLRSEVGKSKSVLQDASLVIGIDTLDSQGLISLSKGRDGGEGTSFELVFIPNNGIIREAFTDTEEADIEDEFAGVF